MASSWPPAVSCVRSPAASARRVRRRRVLAAPPQRLPDQKAAGRSAAQGTISFAIEWRRSRTPGLHSTIEICQHAPAGRAVFDDVSDAPNDRSLDAVVSRYDIMCTTVFVPSCLVCGSAFTLQRRRTGVRQVPACACSTQIYTRYYMAF